MINLGIIGTGLMAKVIAKSCANIGVKVYSVLSRSKNNAESFCSEFCSRKGKGYTVPKAFFEDPGLDAVYIATPSSTKEFYMRLCLEYKKHILVEKPLPSSVFLSEFLELSKERNIIWMDATHFVHNELYNSLPKLIDRHVGKIVRIDSNFFWPSTDYSHIKFNLYLEDKGALGDLGWYPIRMILSLIERKEISKLDSFVLKKETGAIVEFNAIGLTSSNITFSMASSYRGSTTRQEVTISGEKGEISIQDFVMPYCGSFVYGRMLPFLRVKMTSGLKPLVDKEYKKIFLKDLQHHRMVYNFIDFIKGNKDKYILDELQKKSLDTIRLIETIQCQSGSLQI
ncbi:Gfo/Idh/MocA family oxidoreductase [Photorhabdus sp. P32]|uniref:Gfo/Idh/MocA family protein n=1 Tax=Photorhabdus sp. P32 TaxID=3117549 RepID=UPI00311B01EB